VGRLGSFVNSGLGLFFWSGVWTLVGWCELRKGFRTFRLDRITGLTVATEPHVPRAGELLEDYGAMVRAENPEA
jgi:predicted DNA-binding transcriptional regulator YafY